MGLSRVTDFAPLVQLTRLTHLDLEDTSIRDLTPIAGLTKFGDAMAGAPVANNRRLTVYIDRGQEVRNRGMLKGRVQVG